MDEERSHSFESFFKGFIAGSLIGAGLALIFAPKSGREFREDIKKKSAELKKDADLLYSEAKDRTTEWWHDGLKRAEQLKAEAEEKLEEAKEKVAEVIEEGKKWADKLKSKSEELLTEAEPKSEKEKKADREKKK